MQVVSSNDPWNTRSMTKGLKILLLEPGATYTNTAGQGKDIFMLRKELNINLALLFISIPKLSTQVFTNNNVSDLHFLTCFLRFG